jgi:hypothetical protein
VFHFYVPPAVISCDDLNREIYYAEGFNVNLMRVISNKAIAALSTVRPSVRPLARRKT